MRHPVTKIHEIGSIEPKKEGVPNNTIFYILFILIGIVLYQKQGGVEKVIAYSCRRLRTVERKYPAHKLEFLALKWAVTDKFQEYLYGNQLEVVTARQKPSN